MADGRATKCNVAYGAIRARSTAEGDMPPRKPATELFDPQDFLAKVGTGKTISKVKKDQVIYSQGEPADSVFYIQKGRIKVLVHSDQGKEAVVGILEAGQFFGEGCLNGHALRIATTSAMEECLLTAIAKTTMIAMLHDEPKFSESVRRLQAGLHSFLSIRRIEARRRNANAFRLMHSQSLASRRQRLSQAMVRSTIQRLGRTTNPLA
jgi:CRP-like cAMP-binding protein